MPYNFYNFIGNQPRTSTPTGYNQLATTLNPATQIPTAPNFNSQFLPMLANLFPSFQNFNPFPQLAPDVRNLITTQTDANAKRLFDANKVGLYGRGFESSSEDIRTGSEIASNLAAQQAMMELGARQQAGQGTLNALQAGAGAAGTGAGIESNVFGTQAGIYDTQYGGAVALIQSLLPLIVSQLQSGGTKGGGFRGGGLRGGYIGTPPTSGSNNILDFLMKLFGGSGQAGGGIGG